MKTRVACLFLLVPFLLSGCGSIPKVNASPAVPPKVNQKPGTPSSAVADCSPQTIPIAIDQGTGFLKVTYGMCWINVTGTSPVGVIDHFTYTLKNPVNARKIDNWIGTAEGSSIEAGYEMVVTTPDGREAIINNEFDKHQDTIGSQWREYNLPLNLPAGTVLNIEMSLGFPHGAQDCPNRCAVQAVWFFNHGID